MRYLLTFICLTVLLASCQYFSGSSDHKPIPPPPSANNLPDLKGQKLTIGVDRLSPPYTYIVAETQTNAGWDYEVWCTICKRLNCEAVFVETTWPAMFEQVQNGELDVGTGGITITEDRAKKVQFSNAYVTVQQRLVGRNGESRFKDYIEFANNSLMRLGTISYTNNYSTALNMVNDETWRLKTYTHTTTLVKALIKDKVDGIILDEVGGQPYRGHYYKSIEPVGRPIESNHLAFIYPLENEFSHNIDFALDDMRADGALMRFHKKYFSSEFILKDEDILWDIGTVGTAPPLPTCTDIE